jgi:glycosyltransferase involved in cell wall biosynthesis
VKIVILTQYYPPEVGAAQVRLSCFARELRRAGHDVRVVTALPNYPTGRIFDGFRSRFRAREQRDGVPVYRTWLYPAQSAGLLPRLASYFSFALTACTTIPFVGRPDYIFVESPPLFLGLTGHFLARVTGAKWMMNVSDLWPDTVVELGMLGPGPARSLAFGLERWLYRRARFVVAVTEGIRQRLRDIKGVPNERTLFLPNGADTELFQPRVPDETLLAEQNLAGKAVFVYAGLHGHAQDLPTIMEAATCLAEREDVAIVLVGDGPVKADAIATATARGLRNVRFIPPQPLEAMPRWWSIARGALVTLRDLPLFDGARPSKALPPLASGVPVVYAGRGELATILAEAGCGLVVPPGRPAELAAALGRLADRPAEAAELGRGARALALARFSWPRIVTAWLAELQAKGGT